MQKPTSSFFNFKATESERVASNDFQARVGALDDFEAHYSFFANEIDEQEQSYDFEARFNPTDEMCAYYNFSVKVVEHDTRYDFYAKYEVLPMVIDYEDEMMVMVVREATLERHSLMNAAPKTAEIERKQTLESNNDRAAVVDGAALLNRRKEVAVELNRADKATPLAEQPVMHFEDAQSFESKRNHEAVVNESQSAFVPIDRALSIDYVERFNKSIELSAEINASETATPLRNYIADVEALNETESRAEYELTVENSERLQRIDERFVDVSENVKLDRVKEVSTEIESTVYIKFGAAETDIEQSVKSERVDDQQAAIESADRLKEVQERMTAVETSEQLGAVLERPTTVEDYVELSRRLEQTAELTDFTTLCACIRKPVEIEQVSAVSSNANEITIIEHGGKAEHVQVSFAEIENNTKANMTAEKLAVVEHVSEAYKSVEFTAARDSTMKGTQVVLLSAEIEASENSKPVTFTAYANIDLPQELTVQQSFSASLSAIGTTTSSVQPTVVVERADKLKRLDMNVADLEDTIGIKFGAIGADVETISTSERTDEAHAVLEQSACSSPTTEQATMLETSWKANVEAVFTADFEHAVQAASESTHLTSLELSGDMTTAAVREAAAIENQETAETVIVFCAEVETPTQSESELVHNAEIENGLTAEKRIEFISAIETQEHSTANPVYVSEVETSKALTAHAEYRADIEAALESKVQQVFKTEIESSEAAAHHQIMLTEIETTSGINGGAVQADIEESLIAERTNEELDTEVEHSRKYMHKRTIKASVYKPHKADSKSVYESEIEMSMTGDSDREYEVTIETPISSKSAAEYIAELELPIDSENKLIKLMTNVEQTIKTDKDRRPIEADIEQPMDSIRSAKLLDTSIEDVLLQEKVKIVLDAAIEEQFTGEVFVEYLAEIEDTIIGQFPEVEDEEEKKKLVWLIMGRPSWLHRYWQRTTR